ncbi:DNA polymerase IV [Dyadobacter sandarakinus]|uniref:DNA polymerase IV n=1 Tax=Dyadobacter sandarakinus TaxID=2747268 RepID=A0ABX7I329_9BACT|nr:DNA polymerase IV [Dyadobacter sandarakinus]QRR00497.1 DNA polymerase IV [Dyadobacter sandarakinus]
MEPAATTNSGNPLRKIIHIDMDAFYASVEQRDFPQYRGKPIAVGGSPTGRGVVATASYEARKYGVKSAMSSAKAIQLCPQLIFVRPRFDVYKTVSSQIRDIFRRYTDIIEPLSLDEAFLDVTVDKQQIGSAMDIAGRIKAAIRDELHLTASAGVSVNKFVAKIASDINKPDGITFIGPSKVETFINNLPVEKFFGVGRVTAAKMQRMQLFTGADLKKLTEDELVRHFGKTGRFFYQIVRGIDDRQVQPHRETKSLGPEDTFTKDLTEMEDMYAELERIGETVCTRLEKKQLKGRTLTLKVKFADFTQLTRNYSFLHPVGDLNTITGTAIELLNKLEMQGKAVRLLGISLSNFGEREVVRRPGYPEQLELFPLT